MIRFYLPMSYNLDSLMNRDINWPFWIDIDGILTIIIKKSFFINHYAFTSGTKDELDALSYNNKVLHSLYQKKKG